MSEFDADKFGDAEELEKEESLDDEEAGGPDAKSVSFPSLEIKTAPDGRIVFDQTSIREFVHLAVVCVFAFLGFLFAVYVEPDGASRGPSSGWARRSACRPGSDRSAPT